MIKKYNNIKSIIIPNKKINIFVISVLFLGLISGAIFTNVIGTNDKTLIIEKIKLFIDNINNNNINNIVILKNSFSNNIIYISLIWILGMTLIGILFNIFILFIKGFILGFSISSFIITYSYKGIILSSIYLIIGQLINILTILVLTIYSITYSTKLIKQIFNKTNQNNNLLKFIRNYCIILIFTIISSIISSALESFLLPAIIKLIIKIYI